MIPVILSGGSGTRLWPLSRESHPKQFLPLTGGSKSLLQSTVERIVGFPGARAPLVVCNEEHRFLVAEQLRQLDVQPEAILLEPVGRNTAPAVALAALAQPDPDSLLLVMPADHVIPNVAAFHAALSAGLELASMGRLVTFGVVPQSAHTGYGYIRADRAAASESATLQGPGFPVLKFVEKPDLATAESYLAAGDYFWNSGMFLFKAATYLEELEQHAPDILKACREALEGQQRDRDFVRLDAEAFTACRSDSVDYAVMERTDKAMVVPLDAGWSDVGSWDSLWEVGDQDAEGNVLTGDVLTEGVRNTYIHAQQRLVAAVGLQDLVIVETGDAVLVMDKYRTQDVKQIVARLRQAGRAEAQTHRCVARPWGTYECIDGAERFQVKRITVKPGEKLSLQMHHHRAEHWVVVRGTARITRGEEVFVLSENESTYIPLGVKHRLENPGRIPLELIEVQSGAYLGEDDIVRFEDTYGRAK
ncbi:mannose-1-phosphate guanylyltransferase/mannose-6-phosphate isomerase [Thioalkalivibrio sulfidiphilus]|uniref:mannose-1-phosphate guanylyltransferase/mannose-6-phosphate isomerase n=1 Tax=Thioalkalivibrio sulfidiphilus TaxID=1033854 RepID=UPI0003A20082|nr:mannose-1-phosphate guanylyltransferase/mannose-6-phosphate isomerase [Thioalkalivibrio sulfidiphilus]